MIRIAYNLGKDDWIQENYFETNESEARILSEVRAKIENHKRLFPEPESNLTGLKSEDKKINLTGLKSKRGKSNVSNKSK